MAATLTTAYSLPSVQLSIAAALLLHWISPPVDHPVRVSMRRAGLLK